jgi:hypothetical protein
MPNSLQALKGTLNYELDGKTGISKAVTIKPNSTAGRLHFPITALKILNFGGQMATAIKTCTILN